MLRLNKSAAIFCILLLAALFRLVSLNQSFWLDEAAQAVISSQNLIKVNWGADFQPPGFYVLTWLWQQPGIRSEWFLRLLPVFFGVLTVYVSFIFFKKLFDEGIALVSALLIATAPYHLYFSQEYRMYSLFTLQVLLSWLFLWERRWVFYAAAILLALCTHYFAFLALAAQLVFMILTSNRELKKYVTILCLASLPLLFWFPTLQKQIQTAGNLISVWPRWGEVAGVSFLKFPFLFLAKTTVGMISLENKMVYTLIVGIAAVIFLLAILKMFHLSSFMLHKLNASRYTLLFCYFFVPIILAWISGLFVTGNSPHRLIFVLPAFYGILAVGLTRAGPCLKKGPTIMLIYLFLQNIIFLSLYLFNTKYHREAWRDAVSYTDKKIWTNEMALTEYIDPWAPIIWYSKKPEKYLGASATISITNESIKKRLDPYILNLSQAKPRDTKSLPANRQTFILYTYLFEVSDPQRLTEQYLIKNGFRLVEEKDFRGVGIIKTFAR